MGSGGGLVGEGRGDPDRDRLGGSALFKYQRDPRRRPSTPGGDFADDTGIIQGVCVVQKQDKGKERSCMLKERGQGTWSARWSKSKYSCLF